jgi:SAM-dependent methyltransferase
VYLKNAKCLAAESSIYDLDNGAKKDDIPFWRSLSEEWGHSDGVVEFGCGTLRLSIPIAETGVSILGVDESAYMLAQARRKLEMCNEQVRGRVLLTQGDIRGFRSEKQYGFAFAAYNLFATLGSHAHCIAAITSLRDSLLPNGVAAIEVPNLPSELRRQMRDTGWRPYSEFSLPGGTKVTRRSRRRYLADSREILFTILTETQEGTDGLPSSWKSEYRVMCYDDGELEDLTAQNGFEVVATWGNYKKTPFSNDANMRIILLRKEF